MAISIEAQEAIRKGDTHVTVQAVTAIMARQVEELRKTDLAENTMVLHETGDVALKLRKKLDNMVDELPDDVPVIPALVKEASTILDGIHTRVRNTFKKEGSFQEIREATKAEEQEMTKPFVEDTIKLAKVGEQIETETKRGLLKITVEDNAAEASIAASKTSEESTDE